MLAPEQIAAGLNCNLPAETLVYASGVPLTDEELSETIWLQNDNESLLKRDGVCRGYRVGSFIMWMLILQFYYYDFTNKVPVEWERYNDIYKIGNKFYLDDNQVVLYHFAYTKMIEEYIKEQQSLVQANSNAQEYPSEFNDLTMEPFVDNQNEGVNIHTDGCDFGVANKEDVPFAIDNLLEDISQSNPIIDTSAESTVQPATPENFNLLSNFNYWRAASPYTFFSDPFDNDESGEKINHDYDITGYGQT